MYCDFVGRCDVKAYKATTAWAREQSCREDSALPQRTAILTEQRRDASYVTPDHRYLFTVG